MYNYYMNYFRYLAYFFHICNALHVLICVGWYPDR